MVKSQKSKTVDRSRNNIWMVGTILLLGVVLAVLAIANNLSLRGDNAYRAYAQSASWVAGVGLIASFVGIFITKSSKYKVLLGIEVALFLLLALYAGFLATFYITW